MPVDESGSGWRRLFALPEDSPRKAVAVSVAVAFVSALVVSSTAVLLKPRLEANAARERAARIEALLDALPAMRALMLEAGIDAMETRIVDLASGAFDPTIDPAGFDPGAAARDPARSVALPPEADTAGLRRRATHAPVHLLAREGVLHLVVLPVSGTGYQSTIRALLALEPDLDTVAGLTILAQGETPGIGARIEDPGWQALWPGTRIADAEGGIRIGVALGPAAGMHEVDGISGATRTGQGVTNMLRFWLGEHGFGPFLARLKREGL